MNIINYSEDGKKGRWQRTLRAFRFRILMCLGCLLPAAAPLLGATADLALQVTASPRPVVVGNKLTLTFSISNQGPDIATGIILSNPLPQNAIFTSALATNGSYTFSNNLFCYALESLAPSAPPVVVQLVVTPMNADYFSNRTSVIAAELDPWAWDNVDCYIMVQVLAVAPGAKLSVAREYHTATLLQDGRVLVVGGDTFRLTNSATAVTEIYDPRAERFVRGADLNAARYSHTATLLENGNVLIAGGQIDGWSEPMDTTELYDPIKDVFIPSHKLNLGRSRHTATVLSDGRVLFAGGISGSPDVEIFDPNRDTCSPAGKLLVPRTGHVASLLPNGKVLLAGGATSGPFAELFDPNTGTSLAVPDLITNHVVPVGVGLADGKVLIFDVLSAEVYDPITAAFVTTGTPQVFRGSPSLTLLNDGRVLVSGGGGPLGDWQSTDIYDPLSGAFSPGPPMTQARKYHTATRLLDGRVLIVAGFSASVLASSEVYALIVDADQDGMDDAWELKYGLNPADRSDALEDADGDGLNNLQEYLAGTDPRDPNSALRIDTFNLSADLCRIRFTSVVGKLYRVERTSTWPSQGWTTVADKIPGSGTVLEVLDPIEPGATNQLYRVCVLH